MAHVYAKHKKNQHDPNSSQTKYWCELVEKFLIKYYTLKLCQSKCPLGWVKIFFWNSNPYVVCLCVCLGEIY